MKPTPGRDARVAGPIGVGPGVPACGPGTPRITADDPPGVEDQAHAPRYRSGAVEPGEEPLRRGADGAPLGRAESPQAEHGGPQARIRAQGVRHRRVSLEELVAEDPDRCHGERGRIRSV
jgi:hypothetical protein